MTCKARQWTTFVAPALLALVACADGNPPVGAQLAAAPATGDPMIATATAVGDTAVATGDNRRRGRGHDDDCDDCACTSCWDLDDDGHCSAAEDVNHSGACDAADCRGAAGPAGPAGPPGAQGAPGAIGPAGPAGPAGADGAIGPEGPAGAAGADGAIGPAGPAGPAGADGAIGPAGPAGPAGADGAIGAAGPAGPPGADGAAGPAGADGAIGPAGPAGPAGPDGAVGPAGPAGASTLLGFAAAPGGFYQSPGPTGVGLHVDLPADAEVLVEMGIECGVLAFACGQFGSPDTSLVVEVDGAPAGLAARTAISVSGSCQNNTAVQVVTSAIKAFTLSLPAGPHDLSLALTGTPRCIDPWLKVTRL